jgi:D-alanine-D-alanine ligase
MKRIAVLRGGPSNEYEVSMRSGQGVLKALETLGYVHKDIVITRKGEWLEKGFSKSPQKALEGVDVVFIALHGEYGEDGRVQRELQRLGLPFTGSNALASATAFNKVFTKDVLRSHNVRMPKHRRLRKDEVTISDEFLDELHSALGEELFIKPTTSGSSHGARYVGSKEMMNRTLTELLQEYDELMVEEFIRGKEATVGILESFRNQPKYVLPVIEIVPPMGEPLFSYENKYNGKTDEICPGRFSYHEKSKLSEAALIVHDALRCSHYSRSDFIVRNGEVYFLEINTLPGLTDESLLPKAAAAVGLSYADLIHHLVETARP